MPSSRFTTAPLRIGKLIRFGCPNYQILGATGIRFVIAGLAGALEAGPAHLNQTVRAALELLQVENAMTAHKQRRPANATGSEDRRGRFAAPD
jgi:hypothetical protein